MKPINQETHQVLINELQYVDFICILIQTYKFKNYDIYATIVNGNTG